MYFHKYTKYSNKYLDFIGGAEGAGDVDKLKDDINNKIDIIRKFFMPYNQKVPPALVDSKSNFDRDITTYKKLIDDTTLTPKDRDRYLGKLLDRLDQIILKITTFIEKAKTPAQPEDGGGGGGSEKFRLITTGFGMDSIKREWPKYREQFLSLIPDKYNEINIIHSDPGIDDESSMTLDLISRDKSIRRVKSSIVTKEYLTRFVDEQKGIDYLILDCAHIFDYVGIGQVKCNGNIHGEQYSETNKGNVFNYRSIYVGYFGREERQTPSKNVTDGVDYSSFLFNYLLSRKSLFTVKEDGSVHTYIDRLLELRIPLFGFNNGAGGQVQVPHETFLGIYKTIDIAGADSVRALSAGSGIKWFSSATNVPEVQKYFLETIISGVLSGRSIDIIKEELIKPILTKIKESAPGGGGGGGK